MIYSLITQLTNARNIKGVWEENPLSLYFSLHFWRLTLKLS